VKGVNDGRAGYQKSNSAESKPVAMAWNTSKVDTCCVNKSDNVELQYTINAMFRWYANVVKCYAYLLDIPGPILNAEYLN
jgi:hypothetical protein